MLVVGIVVGFSVSPAKGRRIMLNPRAFIWFRWDPMLRASRPWAHGVGGLEARPDHAREVHLGYTSKQGASKGQSDEAEMGSTPPAKSPASPCWRGTNADQR